MRQIEPLNINEIREYAKLGYNPFTVQEIALKINEVIASLTEKKLPVECEESLTNGGKPHICGRLQVYSAPKGEVPLCSKCGMAVDSEPEKTAESWEKEFTEKCHTSTKRGGFDLQKSCFSSYTYRVYDEGRIREFIKKTLSSHTEQKKEELRKKIEDLDTKPGEFGDGYSLAAIDILHLIKEL